MADPRGGGGGNGGGEHGSSSPRIPAGRDPGITSTENPIRDPLDDEHWAAGAAASRDQHGASSPGMPLQGPDELQV